MNRVLTSNKNGMRDFQDHVIYNFDHLMSRMNHVHACLYVPILAMLVQNVARLLSVLYKRIFITNGFFIG